MIEHARDIPDDAFLRAVDTSQRRRGMWANRVEVGMELGDPPTKVVLAKARRLMSRGLLDGCACGCRGDFEVTTEGRKVLDR